MPKPNHHKSLIARQVQKYHDELYTRACQLIQKGGYISPQYLQRNLRIPYATAEQLIVRMEDEAITQCLFVD